MSVFHSPFSIEVAPSHAAANDYRYLASRLEECETRAGLMGSILQWDGPDDDDPLHQQLKSEVEETRQAAGRAQIVLQTMADRDVPGLDCRMNYCYGSAAFQEGDPIGDYEATMERWNDPAYWEPAPQTPRKVSRWSRWARGVCRILTWRPAGCFGVVEGQLTFQPSESRSGMYRAGLRERPGIPLPDQE